MKTLLLAFCGCLLLPLPAHGHIGSPNVFFDGHAGPHSVRVIIRPPVTLPGIAQVDVRVASEGVTSVTLAATPWEAGEETAAAPVFATPVIGETGLFNAPLWLLTTGSYRVRIVIESPLGRGTVSVPLNSAATQRPAMPPALGLVLASLGGLLFIGAVGLAGAAARESTLEPGVAPAVRDYRRGHLVMVIATLLLAAALWGGTLRWRTMDREFRNNALHRALPVEATIRNAGPLRLLHLAPSPESSATAWDTLVADHGKLLHLFLLREPDCPAFAHLHPVRRDRRTFENVLPPLPAGTYQLYGEITYENGLNETLTARLAVPAPSGPALPPMADWKMVNEVWCRSPGVPLGNAGQPFALDADDSWHIATPAPAADLRTQVSVLTDGSRMVFHNAGDLVENRETSLRFSVFTTAGRRAALQPYMGMAGHAVIRRADGAVFTHLHPVGSVSMAATELLASRARAPGEEPAAPAAMDDEVTFPYAFPQAGEYRLWMQVRLDGQVRTGVFAVRVAPAP